MTDKQQSQTKEEGKRLPPPFKGYGEPGKAEGNASGLARFWQEMKRRKVVRVAAVYAVVGWLVIQVAVSVFPTLAIPGWALSLIVMSVILGFPISLVLAWAFEVTPGGIKTASEVQSVEGVAPAKGHRLNYAILGLVVLVLMLQIVDRYLFNVPRAGKAPEAVPIQANRSVIAGTINLPEGAALAYGMTTVGFDNQLITLSPKGEWMVYVGRAKSGSQLYRRHLGGFEDPVPIPGTEGAVYATFSPDGKTIGFLTNRRLKRITVEGEDLRTIATASVPVRAHWTDDDLIYFSDEEGGTLRRVPAYGGKVESVSELSKNFSSVFSDISPDGRFGLATQNRQSVSGDFGNIVLFDFSTGILTPLGLLGYDARWIPTGHLVFGRNGNLMAVQFDGEQGVVLSKALPVIQNIGTDSLFQNLQLAISVEGTLAYIPGADRSIGNIVEIDRQGKEKHFPKALPERYGALDLSKDDGYLAVHVADVKDYAWIYDLRKQEGRKLFGSDGYGQPKWHPDGSSLALSSISNRDFGTELSIFDIQSATSELVYETNESIISISDWSPDKKELAISNFLDIGFISAAGGGTVQWVDDLAGGVQWGPVFSQNGKWVAYCSNETGDYEVWIRSYPGGKVRRQVSANGGLEPVWSESGEIFFRRGFEIWSSKINLDNEPILEPEQHVFTIPDFVDTSGRSYDVSSDGQILYAVKSAEPIIDERIHVIGNWFEELNRLVPPNP